METPILCGTLLTEDSCNPTDFPLESIDISRIGNRHGEADPAKQRPHISLHQLDLKPYGDVSCFLTAPAKMILDTFPLDTPELRKKAVEIWHDAWEYIISHGLVTPGLGGRISDGVDTFRRAYNAAMPKERQIRTYYGMLPRFDKQDETHLSFYRMMNNGWMACIGRFTDSEQYQDILDGTLNVDTKPTGKAYGHLHNVFTPGLSVKRVALDNYPKHPAPFKNVYLLDDFETKVQNGLLYPRAYYSLPA